MKTITITGDNMTAFDVIKPAFLQEVSITYRSYFASGSSKKQNTIKSFIDLLNFIEENKNQKYLTDLFLFYIDQPTISGVKFDGDIANHPVYKIIEGSLENKNPM